MLGRDPWHTVHVGMVVARGPACAARPLQAACHQCASDAAGPGLRLGRQAPRPWQPEWPGRACRLVPAHWHWQARGRRCAAARLERAQ
jgi:hypothetical protein